MRTAVSPPLGDYMAGAPAVARRASASGARVAVVPLPANDALAVLDAKTGALIKMIPPGVEPIAAVITDDGATAFVTILGGAKPTSSDRSATQYGADPRAEAVRVDARGIALPGAVARVDIAGGKVAAMIGVGRHPTAIAFDASRQRLYVADGNAPDPASVRVEEWVNAFDQDYPAPEDATFAVRVDGAPSPFIAARDILLRVGIKARASSERARPAVALTFVIDTSGSMERDGRLELVTDGDEPGEAWRPVVPMSAYPDGRSADPIWHHL
jgi:hypothetical protein